MSDLSQRVRIDLKCIEISTSGRVVVNHPKLADAINKAKASGVEYVFLEAETGDFCVAKSQPCA